MGPEAAIEKKICDFARKTGWMVFKFTSPSSKGVPDRIFLSPRGVTVFMEIKDEGRTPDPLQLWHLNEITKRGGIARWVDSAKEGIEILSKIK